MRATETVSPARSSRKQDAASTDSSSKQKGRPRRLGLSGGAAGCVGTRSATVGDTRGAGAGLRSLGQARVARAAEGSSDVCPPGGGAPFAPAGNAGGHRRTESLRDDPVQVAPSKGAPTEGHSVGARCEFALTRRKIPQTPNYRRHPCKGPAFVVRRRRLGGRPPGHSMGCVRTATYQPTGLPRSNTPM